MYKISDKDKILVNLARSPKEWNRAYDLIGGGNTFIGYEVSARLTNAHQSYPHIIDSRMSGRFKERRLRIEDSAEWLPTLPKELARMIEEALERAGKEYNKKVVEYVPTENNSVRKVEKLVTYNKK
jgi:hypothetical protein